MISLEPNEVFRRFAEEARKDPQLSGQLPSALAYAAPMLPMLAGSEAELLDLARRAVAAWLRADPGWSDPRNLPQP